MSYPLWHPERRGTRPRVLNSEEFAKAFPEESQLVEFKEGVSTERLQEAVVAFSNSDGGVVLLGVRNDGTPVGRELTGEQEASVHRAIRRTVNPGRYEVGQLDIDDVPVIVVSVARRREGVAQLPNGAVLVRRDASNVALLGEELVALLSRRALTRFETTPVEAGLDEAGSHLVDRLCEARGWSSDSVAERLRDDGLVTSEPEGDRLTVAGALYLLEEPHRVLGKAYVEVFRYPEVESEYDKRVRITGPLDRQVVEGTATIRSELGTQLVILGARRYELDRLPPSVIREAVANAVAHRSYQAAGSAVRVELRSNGVRVISPGPLPEPVTVENIREQNAARNRRVIDYLRQFGLAEDAGRGVDHIQDAMQANLLEPPTFEDTGSHVCVTLPLHSTVAPEERAWVRELETRGALEPADRILLVHAARGETLTNSRARELLDLDSVHARAALQRLRDAGLVSQEGRRGGTYYVLAPDLTPPSGLRLSDEELDEVVLALAREQPVTNSLVRERTGLDRNEALKLLQGLVAGGRLVQIGERRGTRYLLPEQVDSDLGGE